MAKRLTLAQFMANIDTHCHDFESYATRMALEGYDTVGVGDYLSEAGLLVPFAARNALELAFNKRKRKPHEVAKAQIRYIGDGLYALHARPAPLSVTSFSLLDKGDLWKVLTRIANWAPSAAAKTQLQEALNQMGIQATPDAYNSLQAFFTHKPHGYDRHYLGHISINAKSEIVIRRTAESKPRK